MEAVLGWFANPIFGDGEYPLSLKIKHGALLPKFTHEEKLWVKNTADFFALSFGPNNLRLGRTLSHNGQTVTPDLRQILTWIKLEYGDLLVLVAEAGWFSEASVGKEDTVALYLMKKFVNQVLQGEWKQRGLHITLVIEIAGKSLSTHSTTFSVAAVKFDGVQVFGYSAWSLLDGFEWNYGYAIRRGLFYIDFTQPERIRTPKTTAQYYRDIVAHNGFPRDKTYNEVKRHFPCDFHWGIADSTLQVRTSIANIKSKLVLLLLFPQIDSVCLFCRSTSTPSHPSLLTRICTSGT